MAEAGGGETETRWQRIWREVKEARQASGLWQMALALLIALAEFLKELLSDLRRALKDWLPEALRRMAFVLAILSAATVGAHPGWWAAPEIFTDDPCRQPHELRVVTTPDTHLVLRSEADEFMAEQERRGCEVTVSVSSVDTFDDLWAGFSSSEGAWRPELQRIPLILGPHPDIVIPALTAQAEALQQIASVDFTLENEGSIARSAVVLAVPTEYELPARGDALSSLLAAAADDGLRVARPDPERSEAAVLSTRALYGLDSEHPTRPSEREQVEVELSPADVRLDSAASPFCGRDNRNVGIIVPEHVFKTFDSKQLPASLCASSTLIDVDHKTIPITDLPALDYPYVRIRWRGQANRERDRLIDELNTWLRDRLPARGFDAPEQAAGGIISAAQYEQTLSAYREARREIKVLFLLDNSGSMRRNVADGRSLDRGGRLIGRITDRLGGTDWAALWALPGTGRGGASEQVAGGPVDIARKRQLHNEVAALKLTLGDYSPIYAGLTHAVRRTADPSELAVILITDGGNYVPEGRPVEDRPFESVVGELSAAGVRLEVLAVAPEECSFEDLRKLPRQLDPRITTRCVPAAYADVDALASEVIGRLRAGS